MISLCADPGFSGFIMAVIMMPAVTFYILDVWRDHESAQFRRRQRKRRQQPKIQSPPRAVNAVAAARTAQLQARRLEAMIKVFKKTGDRHLLASRILPTMRELGIDTRRLSFNGRGVSG